MSLEGRMDFVWPPEFFVEAFPQFVRRLTVGEHCFLGMSFGHRSW